MLSKNSNDATFRLGSQVSRRELLRRLSSILGVTVAAPALTSILQACGDGEQRQESAEFSGEARQQRLAAICETVIPTTDTPGAIAAGVPDFIAGIVGEVYDAPTRAEFIASFDAFQGRCDAALGMAFTAATDEERLELLQSLNEQLRVQPKAARPDAFTYEDVQLFRTLKELTVVAYFKSEIGATRVLQYDPIPGAYRGCVPLSEVGKTWAT